MGNVAALTAMEFPERLATLRRSAGLSQQALADRVGVHVTHLRRYEAGKSQPTLDVIRKLAVALNTSADLLVFDRDERGPDEDLRLHFEALSRLDPDERQLVKGVIDSIVVKHDVKRSGVSAAEGTA